MFNSSLSTRFDCVSISFFLTLDDVLLVSTYDYYFFLLYNFVFSLSLSFDTVLSWFFSRLIRLNMSVGSLATTVQLSLFFLFFSSLSRIQTHNTSSHTHIHMIWCLLDIVADAQEEEMHGASFVSFASLAVGWLVSWKREQKEKKRRK